MDEIHGIIERITFQNPDNGWTVARMQEPGKRDLTTVVGNMPSVQVGESVRCTGVWKNDHNYGFQFLVKEYEVEQPATIYGIQKYLSSGMIKGIGKHFAEEIVRNYGLDTLRIIEESPDRLMEEVNGIGPKRLERIKQCWQEQKAIREVMVFLQGYGISPTYAQKIFKTYGDESIEIIQKNPYQLARDIWGIGFKTADQTAQKLGFRPDSEVRIDAGVEYVLNELANQGHTCYPVDKFLEKARELLEVEADLIDRRLEIIENEKRIHIAPLHWDGEWLACIWLQVFHLCEQGIAREMVRLLGTMPGFSVGDIPNAIARAAGKFNIEPAENQSRAIANALTEKVHIITGGPGTGKSTITKLILDIFGAHSTKIRLAAPTGRAAKRMSEITGQEAKTIHSLLEFDFSINGFRRNRDHPLDCDALIVDEASMIDTVLMYNLLKAIPDTARLLLIGDVDQLPSVGAGNILMDLIDSNCVTVTRLTEIFRQAAHSKIILNAHKINARQFPDLSNDKTGDFFFIEEPDTEKIGPLIANLVQNRLPKAYGFDPVEDIQVLSPMNRGAIGNRRLNEILQKKLNPSYEPLVKAGRVFHAGDKVMQIQNNYDKEVFNGDIGRLIEIDRAEHLATVRFDQRTVLYDFADLDQLVLAYACSIHKYQGSECPCVIIPLHTTHYMMLFRNLIYTGITRGKRLVIIVGTKKALWMSVKNDKAARRFTGLRQALRSA